MNDIEKGKRGVSNLTDEEKKARAAKAAAARWGKVITPDNVEDVIAEVVEEKPKPETIAKPAKGRVLYSTGEPASKYLLDANGNPYDPFAAPYVPPRNYNPLMDKSKDGMSWERYKFPYIRTPEQQTMRDEYIKKHAK